MIGGNSGNAGAGGIAINGVAVNNRLINIDKRNEISLNDFRAIFSF